MDPASEELERRSRYLSSLIRRTKLSAAPASLLPPVPEPEPAPEPEPIKARVGNPAEEVKAAVPEKEKREVKAVVREERVVVVGAEKEKREVRRGGDGKGKEEIKAGKDEEPKKVSVRVRAADMALPLQRRAIRLAYEAIAAMPRLDSKRLALALKKEFDTAYGPAWHCIVGTSFGSYVTHSLGGFLYFSVDKVYILLFRTAVEPLGHPDP
ncbi:hypothetical protein PR202_gb08904 [Eleusine coracana subsp. coracana]|uniref:Dynein light chain n=1 Tax=Eleusine coracana subsp. coracana TaxID=191504 RepID=A0AAV5EFW9_ELECO|nr:hypothetical protein QOZ80_2BG0190860 [Eleusine coracana subsp. coracana]GJN21432.1 hypothetical protein PR202_gb08904 [Eleusine coracana subsp. coracana]